MPVKNVKAALGNSMKAEEEAVRSRFERAESVLARNDVSSLIANAAPATAATESTSVPSPLPRHDRVSEEEPRVKRDSFTMPVADYELIATLQRRCLKTQTPANKSEILRAGLVALSALSDEDLAALVERLPKVKTGRRPMHIV